MIFSDIASAAFPGDGCCIRLSGRQSCCVNVAGICCEDFELSRRPGIHKHGRDDRRPPFVSNTQQGILKISMFIQRKRHHN